MLSLSYATQKYTKSDSKSYSTNFSKSYKKPNHHNNQSHNNTLQNHDKISYLQQTLGNQEIQRMLKSGVIQPKLKISQPNDPYEREADRVAEQVMRMSIPSKDEIHESDKSENKIHRKCSNCNMNDKKKEEKELTISRKPQSSHSNLEASDEISNQISSTSGGKPLGGTTKDFMESRFRHDFSGTQIHDNSNANNLARSVNARAFTVKNNVFLGKNESISDRHLIAHELVHVIQQTSHANHSQSQPLVRIVKNPTIQRRPVFRPPVRPPTRR